MFKPLHQSANPLLNRSNIKKKNALAAKSVHRAIIGIFQNIAVVTGVIGTIVTIVPPLVATMKISRATPATEIVSVLFNKNQTILVLI